jgi:Cof subfamily protein (haloacid dehalogenase superfamily)
MDIRNIHIAAIDLDDTLLNRAGHVSPASLDVLARWQAQGRSIIIATGRPPRAVRSALPPTLLSVPLICYNGAEIYIDGDKIYQNYLHTGALLPIVESVQQALPSCTIGLEINGDLYLDRPMNRPTPYQVADLRQMALQPAAKVLLFGVTLEALTPLLAALPVPVRILYSARYQFVQILAQTADKAEALRVLTASWRQSLDAVAAFGDDTNDVEMVRDSGLGVAMANAVDEVKAVADLTTRNNDEDGVAFTMTLILDGALTP